MKAKHKFKWYKDITPEEWNRAKKFLIIESFKVNYGDSKCKNCGKIIKHKGICWRYDDDVVITKNMLEVSKKTGDKDFIKRKLSVKSYLDCCCYDCALSLYEKYKIYSETMDNLKRIHSEEVRETHYKLVKDLELDENGN